MLRFIGGLAFALMGMTSQHEKPIIIKITESAIVWFRLFFDCIAAFNPIRQSITKTIKAIAVPELKGSPKPLTAKISVFPNKDIINGNINLKTRANINSVTPLAIRKDFQLNSYFLA